MGYSLHILPFRQGEHEPEIRKWLMTYGKSEHLADELPQHGFIAKDDEAKEYLAAGFLRRLENSSQVILDGFIANPKSFGKRRHFALNGVFSALIEQAKALQCTQILGNSIDASTLKRAERWGFQKLPHVLVALDLGD